MSETPSSDKRPSIMIVDDTPINLQLLTSLLKERGYRPRPVTSGRAAIAAALNEPPDLLLLDISMPEMNGFTVCERFKAEPTLKEIPILFLSALSDMEDKIKGLKVGGADFITKPFRIEEIEARINAHLRVVLLQRQLREQNLHLEEIVAERTRQLDEAYHRLQSLDRVKSEFLLMLAHEMRTPSNGILGVSELLIDICPPSAERDEYENIFKTSRARLLRLLDDIALLTQLEGDNGAALQASACFDDLIRSACESLELQIQNIPGSESIPQLQGDPGYLTRILANTLQLASCFSKSGKAAAAKWTRTENRLILSFHLDSFPLKQEQCGSIFELTSETHTRSSAERLGLAPVVTHRLLLLLGCGIHLESDGNNCGRLILDLPIAS